MYEHNERQMIMPDEFFLPFGGKLDPETVGWPLPISFHGIKWKTSIFVS